MNEDAGRMGQKTDDGRRTQDPVKHPSAGGPGGTARCGTTGHHGDHVPRGSPATESGSSRGPTGLRPNIRCELI